MKEEIIRILMNNFTRGDIETATQQLDKLFGEKYTEEWLVNYINKQSLGGIDLKQYVTNLLYAAYDKGVQKLEVSLFDKWIEDMIDLIDRYYIWREMESKKELLIAFLMEIDECYGMHIREEAEKFVTNYLKQIR
jgi:hypothetical protein